MLFRSNYLENLSLNRNEGFHSKDDCVEKIFNALIPKYLDERKQTITWKMPSERDFFRSIYKKYHHKNISEILEALS